MARLLWGATRSEFGNKGLAQFRATAAAVLDQEGRDLPHAIDNGAIDD